MTFANSIDHELQRSVFQVDPNWSCEKRDARTGAHGLIQYPAMMVPAMQRDILLAIKTVDTRVKTVLDPFVGSGTALTEALALGCDFVGHDINPLAILVSRVKAGPFDIPALRSSCEEVAAHIAEDRRRNYEVSFENQEKWFRGSNSIQLSKIRRAVEKIPSLYSRRFLWLAMAETIRRCSNSRTSTYKLHIRPDFEIAAQCGIALTIFSSVVKRNIKLIEQERDRLALAGKLKGLHYDGKVDLILKDSSKKSEKDRPCADLVITSPPYGDNRTTVPYGQFSYLALQWIPLGDIDANITEDILKSTLEIDAQSLGGKLRYALPKAELLSDISPSFASCFKTLAKVDDNHDSAKRCAAFCSDLYDSVCQIEKQVNPNRYLVWTIGERNMRGLNIPLALILNELHEHVGAKLLHQYPRRIHTKRMPSKNTTSDLMQSEKVCIFKTAASERMSVY